MNRVRLDKVTRHEEEGYCIQDDYANETKFFAEKMPEDDIDLLRFVMDNCSDQGSDLIDFCNENERGITINGVWYKYVSIQEILEKE